MVFGRLTLHDHGPVFLNEGVTRSELDLRKMEALRSVVSDKRREDLEQDIRLARAGVAGERKIVFELANSHYPLVFIHDLCLEHEGARAQIDFLVVTPYHTLVIECKNLVGDIEIDSSGSFVRTFGRFGRGGFRARGGGRSSSPGCQFKRGRRANVPPLWRADGRVRRTLRHWHHPV